MARTDQTGTKAEYGLDMQLKEYFFSKHLNLFVGFDTDTDKDQFARVAGRGGAEVSFGKYDVGFYHRSNHNMDYSAVNQPTHFISENYIYVRYNFKAN